MEFRRGDKVRINKDAPRYPNAVGEVVLIYTFTHGAIALGVYFKVLGDPRKLGKNTFYFKSSDITLLRKSLFHYII